MKHYNIAIFIPHNGCPHQCSFCNQKEITGQAYQPNRNDVVNIIKEAIDNLGKDTQNAEIAFFGGSFTAIDRSYMIELLDATKDYIHLFKGIRLSTRPDYIDDEILSILKSYGVTTIELGAQSMNDNVLLANHRGHTRKDVINASNLIKSYGFDLGLQMMTGLYKSDYEKDLHTAMDFITLNPACVRVYPTVVMNNTDLGKLYLSGEFVPDTLEQSVEKCSEIMMLFYDNNIDLIRLGLHYSDSLVEGALYNNYHPAFKELCENRIFYNKFIELTKDFNSKNVEAFVNPKSFSKFIGQNKSNINKLEKLGYVIKLSKATSLDKYHMIVKENS